MNHFGLTLIRFFSPLGRFRAASWFIVEVSSAGETKNQATARKIIISGVHLQLGQLITRKPA